MPERPLRMFRSMITFPKKGRGLLSLTPAMRKIRYAVAMSLDGYIAGPKGEADWIVMDPEVNFGELWAQFDTVLMGRRTYEAAVARLGEAAFEGE